MTAPKHRPWVLPLRRGVLLGLQLCGVGIILFCGVPFYRELLAGDFHHGEPRFRWWLTLAIMLIQAGYWLGYRHQASLTLPLQVLPGHLALFLARLNFIFAGGVFSTVFFARYDQVTFSSGGMALLFGILFSMFCVSLDLDRIGTALLRGESSPESVRPPHPPDR